MSKQIQYFLTHKEAWDLASRLNRKHARKYHFGDIIEPSHYYMTEGGDVPVYNKTDKLSEELVKELKNIVENHDYTKGCTFWCEEDEAVERLLEKHFNKEGCLLNDTLIYIGNGEALSFSHNSFTHINNLRAWMPFISPTKERRERKEWKRKVRLLFGD